MAVRRSSSAGSGAAGERPGLRETAHLRRLFRTQVAEPHEERDVGHEGHVQHDVQDEHDTEAGEERQQQGPRHRRGEPAQDVAATLAGGGTRAPHGHRYLGTAGVGRRALEHVQLTPEAADRVRRTGFCHAVLHVGVDHDTPDPGEEQQHDRHDSLDLPLLTPATVPDRRVRTVDGAAPSRLEPCLPSLGRGRSSTVVLTLASRR